MTNLWPVLKYKKQVRKGEYTLAESLNLYEQTIRKTGSIMKTEPEQ